MPAPTVSHVSGVCNAAKNGTSPPKYPAATRANSITAKKITKNIISYLLTFLFLLRIMVAIELI